MRGMRREIFLSALLGAVATLAFAANPQAAVQAQPGVPHLSTRIEHSAEFYHHRYGFMGVVAVERAHHLVYESGYGYANMASHTAFDRDTRFPIGSLSKQFTAAAILLLQQDGKLNTSDSIQRYYQNAPAAWSGITLRNLLTQTSGIADIDFGLIHSGNLHRPEELLNEVVGKPVTFAPGTKYEYANINYMLLGLVVERVSGEPYCQFLRDRIFRPLQLNETDCNWNTHSVEHRAYGYAPSPNGPVAFEDEDLSAIAGAGSLYSTADNLIRWTDALFENKLLSKASLVEMTAPYLNGYAYGFDIDGEGAERDINHNGVVDGFFSCLDYIPATRTTVVVLSNQVKQGNLSTPGTLALDTELVRLGMDDDPILPSDGREAQVPAEILRSYAGRYRSDDKDHPTDMILTFQNGRLFMQNIGGSPAPMNAESATRFYLPNQEAEAVFDLKAPGRLEFTNYDPIWGMVFNRVPDEKGSSGAGQSAAQSPLRKSVEQEPAAQQQECLRAARQVLGLSAKVLKCGELNQPEVLESIAAITVRSKSHAVQGTFVRQLVILRRDAGEWKTALRASRDIQNGAGYVGLEYIDDCSPLWAQRIEFWDKRPDGKNGLVVSIQWRRTENDNEEEPTDVAWDKATGRYREINADGFQPEVKNPPHKCPGGVKKGAP